MSHNNILVMYAIMIGFFLLVGNVCVSKTKQDYDAKCLISTGQAVWDEFYAKNGDNSGVLAARLGHPIK